MEQATIVNLLTNSGLKVFGIDSHFVYFQDPSCIYPAFDTILNYAWMTVVVLTAIMLFGWGVLYIKNGTKIDTLFNNAKALILIFCTLGAVKPIVNAIYGDNLFAKQCDTAQVSLSVVNELLEQRNKNFSESDEAILSENLVIIDSAAETPEIVWLQGPMVSFDSTTLSSISSYSGTNTSSANYPWNNSYVNDQGNTSSANYSGNTSSNNNLAYIANLYNPNFKPVLDVAGTVKSSKVVTFINRNGETIRHIGGSTAWRNNNPGNIIASSFAFKHGAVGTNGRWAVFPDEETGFKAAISLLKTKSYVNLSISQAIHKWAPSADGNNPVKYAQKVSNLTGLPINATIRDLSDADLGRVARAIQTVEYWNPGVKQKI